MPIAPVATLGDAPVRTQNKKPDLFVHTPVEKARNEPVLTPVTKREVEDEVRRRKVEFLQSCISEFDQRLENRSKLLSELDNASREHHLLMCHIETLISSHHSIESQCDQINHTISLLVCQRDNLMAQQALVISTINSLRLREQQSRERVARHRREAESAANADSSSLNNIRHINRNI